ncbi:hypothetical protein LIA77_05363 [Sarocladium implicatum]|nr:hypothetical protein LIA77_05363 [Sarocladium implicatum]
MTQEEQPRRRFAPVPIETTYQSVRRKSNHEQRPGPRPELTPEPSPRSTSPVAPRDPMQKRKFAPQLIETSRRSRRVGDAGPATKPTDKTDITPYTKNIYTAKHVPRRQREDSTDEEYFSRPMPPTRRETEDEGVKEYLLELAAKAAERQIQEQALAAFPNSHAREGGVAHFYFQESSDSDELAEDASGPDNQQRVRRKSSNLGLNWWHKHMQEHVQQTKPTEDAMDVDKEPTDSELDKMDLNTPPDPLWTTTKRAEDEKRESTAKVKFDSEALKKTDFATPSPVQKPAGSPFGTPFGGLVPKADPKDKKKKGVSPPMLGDELVFRTCPSPKLTKLETDHPFVEKDRPDKHRDVSGGGGLWRGYCYSGGKNDTYLVPADLKPAPMIATPYPARTPGGPLATDAISDEPSSIGKSPMDSLQVLDERLRRAQARAEKYEKIANEFSDDFVTQVYNYLSLGYPAMARGFDDELARISRIDVSELEAEDDKPLAKGHMLQMKLEDSRAGERCPRWRALRVYITEWARQHPDLDNLDPLAWGVKERRGSWGI